MARPLANLLASGPSVDIDSAVENFLSDSELFRNFTQVLDEVWDSDQASKKFKPLANILSTPPHDSFLDCDPPAAAAGRCAEDVNSSAEVEVPQNSPAPSAAFPRASKPESGVVPEAKAEVVGTDVSLQNVRGLSSRAASPAVLKSAATFDLVGTFEASAAADVEITSVGHLLSNLPPVGRSPSKDLSSAAAAGLERNEANERRPGQEEASPGNTWMLQSCFTLSCEESRALTADKSVLRFSLWLRGFGLNFKIFFCPLF